MRKNNPLHNMLSLPPTTSWKLLSTAFPTLKQSVNRKRQNKSFWTATKLFWVSFATWWQRPRNDSVFLHFLFFPWNDPTVFFSLLFSELSKAYFEQSLSHIYSHISFSLLLLIVPMFLNLVTLQHLLLLVCLLSILLFMSSKPSDLNGGC